MPRLIIGNLSKHHQHFLYRLPEAASTRNQDIPIGGQVPLPGDLSDTDIKFVIDSHRKYGIKSVDEARRIKGFTGLVYSIDKGIPMDERGFIEEVIASNDAALNERGEERRETTTAAISQRLQEIGRETRAPLQRTEVEQVEDTDGTPRVAAGVESVSDNVTPKNQGVRRSGKQ